VGWAAASATYCGFNVPRDALRTNYLAYERKQGAQPDTLQQLGLRYDQTYTTFFAQVQKQPNYCNAKRIERIRADINRHLGGDYTPSDKEAPPPQT
jgi:hypothetical protein